MNIRDNKYEVTAILKDGSTLTLDGAVQKLSWQEQGEEIAQRASLVLAQVKTDKGYLNALLPLCTMVVIKANGKEVFRGVVWEWEYESGKSRDITLTLYDHFIYPQNSRTFALFPAGKSTKDVVGKICADAGIQLNYAYGNATHDKTVFRRNTIADQILNTLDDAKLKLGRPAVATFEAGTLMVREEGYNATVYVFQATESAMSTSERQTMNKLVTKVAIYGNEDKQDRRKLEVVVDGKVEFGELQDVVLRSKNTTTAAAKTEAENILKENGSPKATITANVPDVPEVRKGWKVKMDAGSLLGYFIVKGVTHDASERRMKLELKREGGMR